jgi:outer membrane immunogenic protein
MRSKIVCLLATAFSLGVVQAASAADMPMKAPMAPVAIPYNWTGFYVGVQGGGAWGSVPNSFDVGGGPVVEPAYKTHGALGGIHAGYNWQNAALVLGVVADAEVASIKGDDGGLGGVTDQLKNDWRGSVRGRIGWAFNNFLVYGTGGFAWAHLKYSLNAVAPAVGSIEISNTAGGWTAGGGVEYGFSPAWSAFAEYRYSDFGKHTAVFPGTAFSAPQTIAYSYTDNAVRFGVTYHFGK